jgi:hypothetical protein
LSISLLLEMAASDGPDRVAVVDGNIRLTAGALSDLADGGAGVIVESGASHVVYVGTGGASLPLLLFSSARANMAFTPLNYRLSPDGLRQLVDRLPDPLVVVDVEYRDIVPGSANRVMTSDEFIEFARDAEPPVRQIALCSARSCRRRRPARCCAGRSSTTSRRRLPSTEPAL